MNSDYEILEENMSELSAEDAGDLTFSEGVSLLGHDGITVTRFEKLKKQIVAEKIYQADAATLQFIMDQIYGGQRIAVSNDLPLAQWNIFREGNKRFVKIALDGLMEDDNVSI